MVAVDPVCQVEVRTEDTKFISEYRGRTYYFDSPQCQAEFERDPEGFAPLILEPAYDEHGDRWDGSD